MWKEYYSIVKNVFNLKRQVKNYLKQNSQSVHSAYKELHYADLDDSVSDSNASVPSTYIIEDYCLGLGIDGNIVNSCFSETSQKCFKLNNEAIIELHDSLINKKCEIGKNSVRSYFGFPLAILKLMQILHETLKP